MRLTAQERASLPKRIQEHLGLASKDEVGFWVQDGQVILMKHDALSTEGDLTETVKMRALLKGSGWTTDAILSLTRGEE